jgi:ABC-type sulfate/molybdate transport systems ATPase subunit
MLEAHVVKRRPQFTIDVRIAVGEGESRGLFGASGAGKSTILACIAGAETPDGGSIVLNGDTLFPPSLPLHERRLGYLTQDPNLFPHLRVGENIRFGLTNGSQQTSRDWIAELRERLQLDALWDAPAHAISGGQARRVALARMLARRPGLVLLDEPFAGLDRHLVRELLAAIVDWQRRLGFMMIVVDHEVEIVERLAPRATVIENGRAVQEGRWEELKAKPATPLLAQLLAPL